jgi:predicted site-specific integrase-resolvase
LKQRIETNERNIASLQDSVVGTSGQGVKTRLDALDGGNIQVQADLPSRNIKSIITEIANAQVSDVYLNNSDEPTNYGTLEQRFKADELKIKDVETEIGDAHRVGLRDANDEPIDDTLDRRFDDIDGGNKPSRTLPSVISEVETARDGAASLHARLSAIDNTQDANSVIKRVEALEQTMPDKVNTSDIYSGLNIQEGVTGKVLDAQYGRVLNEKIGGNFTSQDTVASHISSLETEIGNARPYTEDEQTGEIAYGTLDDRFDTVEGRATQLETDVSAIETEINNAHVNNGTLDDRFDAIESDITDLSNAIDHQHGENDELPDGLT